MNKNNMLALRSYKQKDIVILPLFLFLFLTISFFILLPTLKNIIEKKAEITKQKTHVETLTLLKNDIQKLRKKGIKVKEKEKTSLLKRVEEMAQTNSIFARIKRLQPTTKIISGKKREGLTLSLEKTNLNEIAPFLYTISHKSVIDIYDISIQSSEETEETINVSLTLLGGV